MEDTENISLEHWSGSLEAVMLLPSESLEDYAGSVLLKNGLKRNSFYVTDLDCLVALFRDDYYFHLPSGVLYRMHRQEHLVSSSILIAKATSPLSMNFDLRFRDGEKFSHCLRTAIETMG